MADAVNNPLKDVILEGVVPLDKELGRGSFGHYQKFVLLE